MEQIKQIKSENYGDIQVTDTYSCVKNYMKQNSIFRYK